jgi:hypothetical protein
LQLGLGGARDRGRLQRMVRHALIAGGGEITSSQAYDWCFARDRTRARSQAARWSVQRVLERLATPIGRADSIGRPWIWRVAGRLPRFQIEIIGELATWSILPILPPMFEARKGGGWMTALLAASWLLLDYPGACWWRLPWSTQREP